MSDQSDHDIITTLVAEVKNLTESVKEMKASLENLRTSFVTRDEFMQVKVTVMGVANDGGLVRKVDKLEKKFIYYAGVAFILGILILGAWQYFLATRPVTSISNSTINSTAK